MHRFSHSACVALHFQDTPGREYVAEAFAAEDDVAGQEVAVAVDNILPWGKERKAACKAVDIGAEVADEEADYCDLILDAADVQMVVDVASPRAVPTRTGSCIAQTARVVGEGGSINRRQWDCWGRTKDFVGADGTGKGGSKGMRSPEVEVLGPEEDSGTRMVPYSPYPGWEVDPEQARDRTKSAEMVRRGKDIGTMGRTLVNPGSY